MGTETTASGWSSTALGRGSIASGSVSTAMGRGTTASGPRSTAMGRDTTASGDDSVAMGAQALAAGARSVAMGLGTRAQANDMVAIGRYNAPTGVTGSDAPDRPAFVVGNGTWDTDRSHALLLLANGDLRITGPMRVGSFPSTAGTTVCRTANGTLANCSSSERLKDDIRVLERSEAMVLVERLRPVAFRWRESGREDVGLIAEELAALEPRLVTYGEAGVVEGVNYRHLSAVLVAALQHATLEFDASLAAQATEIEALQARLAALEAAVGRTGVDVTHAVR
jgi:autotransporter adhesin